MILIELMFDTAPEQRESAIALARRTMAATHQEEGCILYRFNTDLELPYRFILTELWESEESLKTHFQGEAFKAFWADLPPAAAS
jgi:quinol monooxygenase YgiN